MKNFAITGVAGFVAPRHLEAIKQTVMGIDGRNETVAGRGFGIDQARPSIELSSLIRSAPVAAGPHRHPLAVER